MFRIFIVIWIGFKMAVRELLINKLRTFLSLFGVTIGIFCIIGVLTLVDSLKAKVKSDIKAIGTTTIYIDKWEYMNTDDYPWWKFIKRPEPKINEEVFVKEKSKFAENVCMFMSNGSKVSYDNTLLDNTNTFGITTEFSQIQSFEIGLGRYFTNAEFQYSSPICIIGNSVAEDLFGSVKNALQKFIRINNRKVLVIGVIKKVGNSILGGFDYDHSVLTPYPFFVTLYTPKYANPTILVKAKEGISSALLANELTGIMRQVRKLKPTEDNNFSCNNIQDLSQQFNGFFTNVNIGGWAIAGLSLLVGAFGVANIMFVTVRERRSQIGLKKAIGAAKKIILWEYLLESAFLCLIGGGIGLFLVWILTLIINIVLAAVFPFQLIISLPIILLACGICISLGILSGYIPAKQAADLDPVVAIRS